MASTNGVREIRTRLSLDGETAFRKSLKSVDSSLSSMRSELKMVSTDFEESTNAMYKNQRKAEILTKMQDQLKVKIGALSDAVETSSKAYEEAKKKAEDLTAEYGENSDEAKTAWQEAEKLANKMDRMATMSNNAKTKLNDVTQQLRDVETSLEDAGDEAKKTVSKFDKLSSEISDQEGKLDSLKTSLTNAFLEYGDGSKEVMDLKYEISKLSSELDENKGQLSAAEKSVDEFTKSLEDAGDEANTASDKAKEAANDGFTVLKGAAADLVSDGLSKVYDSLRDVVTELGNADSVYNNFAIKTGASAADMEKYSESIMGLYKEGYGDSLSSISDGMAIVKQSMKDVPTDKLEEVTEYALTLEDAFGYTLLPYIVVNIERGDNTEIKYYADDTLYVTGDGSIDERAFEHREDFGAAEINIGGDVGAEAFGGCTNLNMVTVDCKKICDRAFWGCPKLNSLTIGKSVSEIGSGIISNSAFYISNGVRIKYNGTIAEWNAITKDENWVGEMVTVENGVVICSDGTVEV